MPRTPAKPRAKLAVHPLTPERWPDFEAVVGPRGAYGGCWCMFFRLPRKEFSAGCGEENRKAFRKIVKSGAEPGLLAYVGDTPAGWCAVAPREEYSGLARSRTLKPIDDLPVWSVTCFYIAKPFRRQGVTIALLEAAAKYVKKRGGRAIEGYPNDPNTRWPDAFAYQGTVSAFTRAGFTEVKRVSKSRAIMRRLLVRARAAKRVPAR